MKCALLISGYLRSFRENITNLQKYLFDGNDIDIYIHITKEPEQKYNNGNISLDEIYTLINPKIMIVSKNMKFHENQQKNNIFNENYKYYILNSERKKIEQAENIKYDILIKMRPDVRLQEKMNLISDNDKIYIPKDSKIDISKLNHPTDPHICDIIAFGPVSLMDYYFDFYTKLNELIEIHGTVNETLLYHYLKDIPYEPINIDYIVILSRCNTIAITGDSGSGKTTLSNIIKQLFNNSFILECDRYHKWE
jgi:ABC-type multidrug transport system fused ATPase/permease subunit